jgi:threonine/homoserine/homoserine lactone efflux protein
MFGIHHFFVFLSAGLLLNITPGPDMIYVATRSSSQGKMAGIVSSLGIGTGALIHIIAAAVGLSAIIFYSSITFEIVKWLGASYLIYLGIKSIFNANVKNESHITFAFKNESHLAIYKNAIFVDLLNPKVALFFFAFLPQFANPASPHFTLNIILLGLIFDTCGTIINILVAHFFAGLGKWLNGKAGFHKIKSWFSGSIYILLGIGIAASKK